MNKYEVIEPLGEGSFGRVYKAVKLSTKTFVALKVISKRGRSIKEVKGLRRECEIQRRLDHPNIIKMLDSFETDNEIVVITEFAHKELNTILDKEGILPENKVQPIVWDLVSALYYLHSHRVLHRDLKPQNILIDSENRAKLCDFGFARNMSTGTHVLTSIKGTPLYMAPELIDEQPYDHNADLWSLGCIIYELLMGAPPFRTSSILHLIRLIRHEQIQWPTFLSEHFLSFLKGLLQKDPSKRLSWTEILNHAFVKGHILILEDNNADMPLTRVLSENTLQAKEQQKKDHVIHKVTQQLRLAEATSRTRSSPQNNETKKSDTQDMKNNNVLPSPVCNKMSKLSLENKDNKKSAEKTTKSSANSKNEVLATSQLSGKVQKLNLIEDNHPIENEEWIVFLQKSMEEIIAGETLSLTQPNLANIIVSPLRNSHANPKVLSYVVKSFSLPFAMKGISAETLENIKKTYLEVKLVPNLIYSSKLLLRVRDETANSSPSPANTPSPTPVRYRKITELTEKDLHCLEYTYMLITHLVHLDNDFLSQLCDAIVVLNVYGLLRLFLSICKNKLQLVMDLIAILTHLMRVFPENVEIVERILLSDEEKQVNFVELLRHNEPMLRERTCFFLMFLGKNLTSTKMKSIWNDTVRETVEALMYDSIESVRNAADRTVDELKGKEFYKPTKT